MPPQRIDPQKQPCSDVRVCLSLALDISFRDTDGSAVVMPSLPTRLKRWRRQRSMSPFSIKHKSEQAVMTERTTNFNITNGDQGHGSHSSNHSRKAQILIEWRLWSKMVACFNQSWLCVIPWFNLQSVSKEPLKKVSQKKTWTYYVFLVQGELIILV